MKTKLILFVFTILFVNFGYSHDLAVVNDDGKTIYYNIVSTKDLTLSVTYCGSTYSSGSYYSGTINIPSEVSYLKRNFKVIEIGDYAFYQSTLNSVTFPETIVNIGKSAFYDCTNLDFISLPNSIVEIGESAFSYCTGLDSIKLSENINSINGYTFYYCKNLQNIVIPNSVELVEKSAFYNCSSLSEMTFGENIDSIGQLNFNNKNVTKITLRSQNPPKVYSGSFSTLQYACIDVIVPKGCLEYYQTAEPWKNFPFMYEMGDDGTEPQQCATPEINFNDGYISFSTATPNATIHYTIERIPSEDPIYNEVVDGKEFQPGIRIIFYATADGLYPSEKVTKELYLSNTFTGDIDADGILDVGDISKLINKLLKK